MTSIPRLRATAMTVFRFPKSTPTTDIFWLDADAKNLMEKRNVVVCRRLLRRGKDANEFDEKLVVPFARPQVET